MLRETESFQDADYLRFICVAVQTLVSFLDSCIGCHLALEVLACQVCHLFLGILHAPQEVQNVLSHLHELFIDCRISGQVLMLRKVAEGPVFGQNDGPVIGLHFPDDDL